MVNENILIEGMINWGCVIMLFLSCIILGYVIYGYYKIETSKNHTIKY